MRRRVGATSHGVGQVICSLLTSTFGPPRLAVWISGAGDHRAVRPRGARERTAKGIMKARKRILLLTPPNGAFESLYPQLEERSFEVHEVSDADAALAYVRSQPSLAMMVVDGKAASAKPDLVRAMRALAGDLPVAWLVGEGQETPKFGVLAPHAVFPSLPTPEEFFKRASKLLAEDYYPKSLLITVVSAVNSVLATTFQTAVDVGAPWLKLSSLLPGQYNAFLPFMGRDSAGHVLVSGQGEHIAALGIELGFEPDMDERSIVREVLGEIANQVVGRVKTDCGSYLPDMRVGLPLLLAGREMGITYPSARPCVSVQVGDGRGELHVEFSFHRANVGADESNIQDAGEVVLF